MVHRHPVGAFVFQRGAHVTPSPKRSSPQFLLRKIGLNLLFHTEKRFMMRCHHQQQQLLRQQRPTVFGLRRESSSLCGTERWRCGKQHATTHGEATALLKPSATHVLLPAP